MTTSDHAFNTFLSNLQRVPAADEVSVAAEQKQLREDFRALFAEQLALLPTAVTPQAARLHTQEMQHKARFAPTAQQRESCLALSRVRTENGYNFIPFAHALAIFQHIAEGKRLRYGKPVADAANNLAFDIANAVWHELPVAGLKPKLHDKLFNSVRACNVMADEPSTIQLMDRIVGIATEARNEVLSPDYAERKKAQAAAPDWQSAEEIARAHSGFIRGFTDQLKTLDISVTPELFDRHRLLTQEHIDGTTDPYLQERLRSQMIAHPGSDGLPILNFLHACKAARIPAATLTQIDGAFLEIANATWRYRSPALGVARLGRLLYNDARSGNIATDAAAAREMAELVAQTAATTLKDVHDIWRKPRGVQR